MDQGWAAVLGALVGALATGGGTFLTARSAERLHKRQARREAYTGFLRDLNSLRLGAIGVRALLDALTDPANDDPAATTLIDERVEEIMSLENSLKNHVVAVSLEGPKRLAMNAQMAALYATRMTVTLAERWATYQEGGVWDATPQVIQECADKLHHHAAEVEDEARKHL
ncbi:hypothetical protein [Streptomyces lydicamycinicus]|uniref:hypothetical protein n=1 Tax=Streptomyces lydicamycinicus TaxID=1546107 RepID=UPI003C2F37F0